MKIIILQKIKNFILIVWRLKSTAQLAARKLCIKRKNNKTSSSRSFINKAGEMMKKYICGIDIGGTSVKVGFFGLQGELIKKWEILTDKSEHGIHIIDDIYQSIISNHPNVDEILGYGFGVPGPVINGKVSEAVNLGWKNLDLKKQFSNLIGNEFVCVDNDANVAALGEASNGAASGYKSSVTMTLGTGIGGGVIMDQKIVSGAHGAAGEIGHMLVKHRDGLPCNCGKSGCLETIASATGIKNLYEINYHQLQDKSTIKEIDSPSSKRIFKAAKNGDALALSVVDEVAYYLGYACHVFSVLINPDIIVVGGGVSRAGDFLIDKIKENFSSIVFNPVQETKIVLAQLENDAGIYGAMALVKYHD